MAHEVQYVIFLPYSVVSAHGEISFPRAFQEHDGNYVQRLFIYIKYIERLFVYIKYLPRDDVPSLSGAYT